MKIVKYSAGHMNRWLSCQYMVKRLKIFFFWDQWTDFHELWYVAQGTLAYYILVAVHTSSEAPELTEGRV